MGTPERKISPRVRPAQIRVPWMDSSAALLPAAAVAASAAAAASHSSLDPACTPPASFEAFAPLPTPSSDEESLTPAPVHRVSIASASPPFAAASEGAVSSSSSSSMVSPIRFRTRSRSCSDADREKGHAAAGSGRNLLAASSSSAAAAAVSSSSSLNSRARAWWRNTGEAKVRCGALVLLCRRLMRVRWRLFLVLLLLATWPLLTLLLSPIVQRYCVARKHARGNLCRIMQASLMWQPEALRISSARQQLNEELARAQAAVLAEELEVALTPPVLAAPPPPFTIVSLLRDMHSEEELAALKGTLDWMAYLHVLTDHAIQFNALTSWLNLVPARHILVFMDTQAACDKLMLRPGLDEIQCFQIPCVHPTLHRPLMDCLFHAAHTFSRTELLAFVNGDIILGPSLPALLSGTLSALDPPGKPFMIVAKRSKVNISMDVPAYMDQPATLQRILTKAVTQDKELRFDGIHAIDLFLYPRSIMRRLNFDPDLRRTAYKNVYPREYDMEGMILPKPSAASRRRRAAIQAAREAAQANELLAHTSATPSAESRAEEAAQRAAIARLAAARNTFLHPVAARFSAHLALKDRERAQARATAAKQHASDCKERKSAWGTLSEEERREMLLSLHAERGGNITMVRAAAVLPTPPEDSLLCPPLPSPAPYDLPRFTPYQANMSTGDEALRFAPFLAGVYRWDNWFLSQMVLHPDVTVIDATRPALVVHQDPLDTYTAHEGRPGAEWNSEIVARLAGAAFKLGSIANADVVLRGSRPPFLLKPNTLMDRAVMLQLRSTSMLRPGGILARGPTEFGSATAREDGTQGRAIGSWIVLVHASSRDEYLIRNWLCWAKRSEFTNFVFLAQDKKVAEFLRARSIPVVVGPSLPYVALSDMESRRFVQYRAKFLADTLELFDVVSLSVRHLLPFGRGGSAQFFHELSYGPNNRQRNDSSLIDFFAKSLVPAAAQSATSPPSSARAGKGEPDEEDSSPKSDKRTVRVKSSMIAAALSAPEPAPPLPVSEPNNGAPPPIISFDSSFLIVKSTFSSRAFWWEVSSCTRTMPNAFRMSGAGGGKGGSSGGGTKEDAMMRTLMAHIWGTCMGSMLMRQPLTDNNVSPSQPRGVRWAELDELLYPTGKTFFEEKAPQKWGVQPYAIDFSLMPSHSGGGGQNASTATEADSQPLYPWAQIHQWGLLAAVLPPEIANLPNGTNQGEPDSSGECVAMAPPPHISYRTHLHAHAADEEGVIHDSGEGDEPSLLPSSSSSSDHASHSISAVPTPELELSIRILVSHNSPSVSPLLDSLLREDFLGETAGLVVEIDRPPPAAAPAAEGGAAAAAEAATNAVWESSVRVCRSFRWPHGHFSCRVSPRHRGRASLWLGWVPPSPHTFTLVLEPQARLAEGWFSWLRGALGTYVLNPSASSSSGLGQQMHEEGRQEEDPRLMGLSLRRAGAALIETAHTALNGSGWGSMEKSMRDRTPSALLGGEDNPEAPSLYRYALPPTKSGAVYFAQHWTEFQTWLQQRGYDPTTGQTASISSAPDSPSSPSVDADAPSLTPPPQQPFRPCVPLSRLNAAWKIDPRQRWDAWIVRFAWERGYFSLHTNFPQEQAIVVDDPDFVGADADALEEQEEDAGSSSLLLAPLRPPPERLLPRAPPSLPTEPDFSPPFPPLSELPLFDMAFRRMHTSRTEQLQLIPHWALGIDLGLGASSVSADTPGAEAKADDAAATDAVDPCALLPTVPGGGGEVTLRHPLYVARVARRERIAAFIAGMNAYRLRRLREQREQWAIDDAIAARNKRASTEAAAAMGAPVAVKVEGGDAATVAAAAGEQRQLLSPTPAAAAAAADASAVPGEPAAASVAPPRRSRISQLREQSRAEAADAAEEEPRPQRPQ